MGVNNDPSKFLLIKIFFIPEVGCGTLSNSFFIVARSTYCDTKKQI
jgi:hypothetical protein